MLRMSFILYVFYTILISGNSFLLQKMKTHTHSHRQTDNVFEIDHDHDNSKKEIELFHLGSFPRLYYPNENGQLTWYPIGFSKDFGIKPTKITIRDINYIVWKDKSSYYGIRDCCSHQG